MDLTIILALLMCDVLADSHLPRHRPTFVATVQAPG